MFSNFGICAKDLDSTRFDLVAVLHDRSKLETASESANHAQALTGCVASFQSTENSQLGSVLMNTTTGLYSVHQL